MCQKEIVFELLIGVAICIWARTSNGKQGQDVLSLYAFFLVNPELYIKPLEIANYRYNYMYQLYLIELF